MARTIALILMMALAVVTAAAQQGKPELKKTPVTYTSPVSGAEMYRSYCAACHGKDAKGQGPAAPALKVAPTDLTLLSKKNGGKFPTEHFSAVLSCKAAIPAHGSQDMPVWGNIFWKMSQGHQAELQQRVFNLSTYVQSLQEKK